MNPLNRMPRSVDVFLNKRGRLFRIALGLGLLVFARRLPFLRGWGMAAIAGSVYDLAARRMGGERKKAA